VAVQKKMLRPRNDRKIAGVCAALGRYFDLDITLIRVMAAVALIFTGGTVLVPYIIGWVVIPEEPEIVIAIPQRVG
jgi:phage shock protein C